MDTILAQLQALMADPAVGGVLVAVATLALADFVIAVSAAIGRHDFQPQLVAQWVETHLVARVIPIAVLAVLGAANPMLEVVTVAALASYAAETIASIRETLKAPETES